LTPAEELTAALGGTWDGGYGLAPCVVKDHPSPSLSIINGKRGPFVTCREGCPSGFVLAALRRRGLMPERSSGRLDDAHIEQVRGGESLQAPSSNPIRSASIDKEYRVTLDRIRTALLTAAGMTGAMRQVGGLMLNYTNRRMFEHKRVVCSWLSEATLASLSTLSESGVRKARRALRECGSIVATRQGGAGRGDTTVYQFDLGWVERMEVALKSRQAHRESARGHRSEAENGDSPVGGEAGHLQTGSAGLARGDEARPESLDLTS